MRKLVALCVLLLVANYVSGQKHKTKSPDNEGNKDISSNQVAEISQDTLYTRMYVNGMRFGDYRLAISAMHGLYALHPDKINYLDSLCLLYAQTQNYAQSIFTGREVLKYAPDNLPVISAVAMSEQQLGRYKEALEMYEKEYAKTSSIYSSYQIAVLQYALQKYGAAQAALDRLILNPAALKDKISFSTGSNGAQMVLYKAAAYNLMGIIYQDLKDNEKAKENFKKALEVQPDFVLAQNNLDFLEKKKDTGKEPEKDKQEQHTKTIKNTKTK